MIMQSSCKEKNIRIVGDRQKSGLNGRYLKVVVLDEQFGDRRLRLIS